MGAALLWESCGPAERTLSPTFFLTRSQTAASARSRSSRSTTGRTGRSRTRSARRRSRRSPTCSAALETRDWQRPCAHGQAARLRGRRRHRRSSRDHRPSARGEEGGRSRALRPRPRAPVPDARRDQRRRARRWDRDRSPLRPPHDLPLGPPPRLPEVFLGLFPGWGGTQLRRGSSAPRAAVQLVVDNPLRQNRMLTRAAGARARALRPRPRRRRVPRRVARAARPARSRRATEAPSDGRSRGRRRGRAAGRAPGSTTPCTARRPPRTARSS